MSDPPNKKAKNGAPVDGLPVQRTPSLQPMQHENPTPQSWVPPTSYATKSDKIVCIMVGLPARGKSYISRRLAQYISFFYGAPTKVFNVGDYRRKEAGGSFQSAEFFDKKNAEAMAARQKASQDALADLPGSRVQGGMLKSYTFGSEVKSVQVLLKTDLLNMKGKIELTQGHARLGIHDAQMARPGNLLGHLLHGNLADTHVVS